MVAVPVPVPVTGVVVAGGVRTRMRVLGVVGNDVLGVIVLGVVEFGVIVTGVVVLGVAVLGGAGPGMAVLGVVGTGLVALGVFVRGVAACVRVCRAGIFRLIDRSVVSVPCVLVPRERGIRAHGRACAGVVGA